MELSTIIQSERIERPEEDETVVAESLEMSSAIGKYKGFSTSMDDLFSEPEDCCMFLSCGILLSSRSRYCFVANMIQNVILCNYWISSCYIMYSIHSG